MTLKELLHIIKNSMKKQAKMILVRKKVWLISVEAFVSIGGNPDKSGDIDASKLIKIIKDEFQMTIDIERLIHEIDHNKSGGISYDEFKTLFSKWKFVSITIKTN